MPFEFIQIPANGQGNAKEELKRFLQESIAVDLQRVGSECIKQGTFKRRITRILRIGMMKRSKRIQWKRGEYPGAPDSYTIGERCHMGHPSVNPHHPSYLNRFRNVDASRVQLQLDFHHLVSLNRSPHWISQLY